MSAFGLDLKCEAVSDHANIHRRMTSANERMGAGSHVEISLRPERFNNIHNRFKRILC